MAKPSQNIGLYRFLRAATNPANIVKILVSMLAVQSLESTAQAATPSQHGCFDLHTGSSWAVFNNGAGRLSYARGNGNPAPVSPAMANCIQFMPKDRFVALKGFQDTVGTGSKLSIGSDGGVHKRHPKDPYDIRLTSRQRHCDTYLVCADAENDSPSVVLSS